MNVLLTSAGRRTSLLNAFQAATRPLDGRVWAGDTDPLAAALQVADEGIVLPPIEDSNYLPTVIDHVRANDIDLVVPLIDPGLVPLDEAREPFERAECYPLVSSRSLLDVALDKWSTLQYFSAENVSVPSSWLPENSSPTEWPDPVFVKPRRGSASENARCVSHDGVEHVLSSIDAPILQEVIEAPEITVDALFDLEGTLIHYVPRLRIRTRAGESVQGRTLPNDDLGAWLRPVLQKIGQLGARGPITLQAFLTEPKPTLSEINPRFGGGFPLAHAAGGHYPEWILRMCQSLPLSPRLGDYQRGLCMTRAYTEWFVESSAVESPSPKESPSPE